MQTIVDTSVWSLALRRKEPPELLPQVSELQRLIIADEVVMLGLIRQEILSGIRNLDQFARLKSYLQGFLDLELDTTDYETAAEFFNQCRRNGVQGSNTDFLICAVAHRRNYKILTEDRDFKNFQAYIPIKLA
ncbi:type II toxin-antitoxin system VapC family toxin [Picosynechococcus sp. PCC 73109]|uniref:type II toxin-antitoxin system VapC family toxin n=1 Tax=Picosynechococcus sp. PCC 73109 TaxID=374982 RepID=UPI0007459280|nr:PIN domain-containing protein [Picosynechococcus sp. PCC 73109]AMA09630.1 twitching motility protein PilT [Picosynechococcus sp. PCC 73109]